MYVTKWKIGDTNLNEKVQNKYKCKDKFFTSGFLIVTHKLTENPINCAASLAQWLVLSLSKRKVVG